MSFELDDIVPWGRSFEEYRRMFALSPDDLTGRLLGCGDGPASFNMEYFPTLRVCTGGQRLNRIAWPHAAPLYYATVKAKGAGFGAQLQRTMGPVLDVLPVTISFRE